MYDYILIYISLHQSTYKCREMQALIMVRLTHESATIGISHIRCLQLINGWQSSTFRTYNNNTHIFTLSFFLVILDFLCPRDFTLGLHQLVVIGCKCILTALEESLLFFIQERYIFDVHNLTSEDIVTRPTDKLCAELNPHFNLLVIS